MFIVRFRTAETFGLCKKLRRLNQVRPIISSSLSYWRPRRHRFYQMRLWFYQAN